MDRAIRKSRKKAATTVVAGTLAGIAGVLVLRYAGDWALGWGFVVTALVAVIYGIDAYFDRRPYLVLDECGITDRFGAGERIEWEAVRHVAGFSLWGQDVVRLLVRRDYKPQIRTAWYGRFDRVYERRHLRAIYLRTCGLELDSLQLAALIRTMRAADRSQRARLLAERQVRTEYGG